MRLNGEIFIKLDWNAHESKAHGTIYQMSFGSDAIGCSVRPQIHREDRSRRRGRPPFLWIWVGCGWFNFITRTFFHEFRSTAQRRIAHKTLYPKCFEFISMRSTGGPQIGWQADDSVEGARLPVVIFVNLRPNASPNHSILKSEIVERFTSYRSV